MWCGDSGSWGSLWSALLGWISPSHKHVASGLCLLTGDCGVLWWFGFLPACYWSQHGRFPASHAHQVVTWHTHAHIHTSSNKAAFHIYHIEIAQFFFWFSVVFWFFFYLIKLHNHRRDHILEKNKTKLNIIESFLLHFSLSSICAVMGKKWLLTLLRAMIISRQHRTLQNAHWEIWWMALFRPAIWPFNWLVLVFFMIILCLSWLQTRFVWATIYIFSLLTFTTVSFCDLKTPDIDYGYTLNYSVRTLQSKINTIT